MNTEHELRTFFPCFIRIPVITGKKHDEISSCFHYFSYLFAFIWVCWTVSLAKVLSIRLVFQFTAKHRRKQRKNVIENTNKYKNKCERQSASNSKWALNKDYKNHVSYSRKPLHSNFLLSLLPNRYGIFSSLVELCFFFKSSNQHNNPLVVLPKEMKPRLSLGFQFFLCVFLFVCCSF